MSHRVGAMLIPVPADTGGQSIADPALDILGDFFAAVLTSGLASAWDSRAPGEPIVKTLYKHDPEELDFSEEHLPVLCVWRDGDPSPKRLADGLQETENELRILWVAPPTTNAKGAERFPFFTAFDKAISLAILHERDPAYVHYGDTGDAAAKAYGSDVQDIARIDWWRLQGVTRVPVQVQTGSRVKEYSGYLAILRTGETTATDPSVWGRPTVIHAAITSGGEEPTTLQEFRVPHDDA